MKLSNALLDVCVCARAGRGLATKSIELVQCASERVCARAGRGPPTNSIPLTPSSLTGASGKLRGPELNPGLLRDKQKY